MHEISTEQIEESVNKVFTIIYKMVNEENLNPAEKGVLIEGLTVVIAYWMVGYAKEGNISEKDIMIIIRRTIKEIRKNTKQIYKGEKDSCINKTDEEENGKRVVLN